MTTTPSPINAQVAGPVRRTADGFIATVDTAYPIAAHVRHVSWADAEDAATGALLAAAYTSFDKAGRELGIDATKLATKLDLAALIRAAYTVAMDADGIGGKEPARIENVKLAALCTPLLPFGEALSLAR